MTFWDGHQERLHKTSPITFEELDDAIYWSLYN